MNFNSGRGNQSFMTIFSENGGCLILLFSALIAMETDDLLWQTIYVVLMKYTGISLYLLRADFF